MTLFRKMKLNLPLLATILLSGCGPHGEDIAAEVRKIPVERLAGLEKDGKTLVQKEDIRRRLSGDTEMVEWFAFDGLPSEFADLAPKRIWLTKNPLNLCFYRSGDHSVNLDITWPAGAESTAVLSWGDHHNEKSEVLWRAKEPNQP